MQSVTLEAGPVTGVVDLVHGARLASLLIRGRERLITRPDPRAELPAISWGSFPMLPWVGRLRDGRLEWAGRRAQLVRDLGGHAIHGTVFDRAWTVEGFDGRSVTMRCRLGGGDGWPFAAEVSQTIALQDQALEFAIAVTATEAMPVAVGWHPWFRRDGDEPIRLTVPARQVLETSGDLIPSGALVPATGQLDLRSGAVIGARALDHAYVGLTGPSRIAWPDLELTIHAAPLASVVVHTTPAGVCIEPQSAWPDAIRLATLGIDSGLAVLEANGTFAMSSRWTWRDRGETDGT